MKLLLQLLTLLGTIEKGLMVCVSQTMGEESTIYEQQINWYAGLSYLKQRQIVEAVDYFKRIDIDEYKYEEAHKILDAIRK